MRTSLWIGVGTSITLFSIQILAFTCSQADFFFALARKQVRDAIFSVGSAGIYYLIAVFLSTGLNPESDGWPFSSISEHNSCLYTTRSLFTHVFHATVFRSTFPDIARVRLTWFIIARSYCRLSMFYWGWVLILSELKTCCIADIIIVCGSVQTSAKSATFLKTFPNVK